MCDVEAFSTIDCHSLGPTHNQGGICGAFYLSNDAISSFLLIESWNLCMWDDVVSTIACHLLNSKHNQAFLVPSIYL